MRRKASIVINATIMTVLAVWLSGCSYNKFSTQEEAIKAQWAEVQNQLQRRNDLIPNLVETVKGYAAHESGVFKDIAESRSRLLAAKTPEETIQAANQQTSALGRLLAVVENYPQPEGQRAVQPPAWTNSQAPRTGSPSRGCATTSGPGIQHAAPAVPVQRDREDVRLQGIPVLEVPPEAAPGPQGRLRRNSGRSVGFKEQGCSEPRDSACAHCWRGWASACALIGGRALHRAGPAAGPAAAAADQSDPTIRC